MNAWMARGAVLWPGVVVSGVVATAALFLAEHYGAPVMLFALLLGVQLLVDLLLLGQLGAARRVSSSWRARCCAGAWRCWG
ncbi:MAG TPA: hypothetical protein PKD73_09770 [Burkholderiaceae bacterium]|nr:hypothetical protein [Burkholderiaceae bacterium]